MSNKSTCTAEVLTETVEGRIKITKTSDGSIRGAIRIDNFSGDTKKEKSVVKQKNDTGNENTNREPLKKNEDWLISILKIFKPINLIQYTVFIGILSGIYGFSFQKGIVDEMGLGGFGVSYNIEDMYYYSFIDAALYVNNFDEKGAAKYALFISLILFLILIIFFLCLFLIDKKTITRAEVRRERNKSNNYWVPIIVTLLLPAFMYLVQIKYKYVYVFFGFFIFVPGFYGYDSGQEYMKEVKSKELCSTDERAEKCVQITKNGLVLTGEMILETNDAFFIRKKDYFLHISKIGANCAFSHYVNPKTKKQEKEKKPDLDPEIEAICFNQSTSQKIHYSQG